MTKRAVSFDFLSASIYIIMSLILMQQQIRRSEEGNVNHRSI